MDLPQHSPFLFTTPEQIASEMEQCRDGQTVDLEALVRVFDEAMVGSAAEILLLQDFFAGHDEDLRSFLELAEQSYALKDGTLHHFAVRFGLVKPVRDDLGGLLDPSRQSA